MEMLNDILGYKDLKIYQNDDFFSFSLDSIILANYCTIRLRDKNILEFCAGNGAVSMIMAKRTKSLITGIEIQEKLYNLALKSIEINNLTNQVKMIHDDVKEYALKNTDTCDLVVCNPPYFKNENLSKKNLSLEKMIARHEVMINLSDICIAAKRVLKDNGTIAMVHRTGRLIDIITEFRKNNIEPKRIKFVYENESKDSHLVLIEGQKNGKSGGLIIEKPLFLYNLDGSLTKEYESIQKEVRV